ncbi:hypothetical protein ACFRMQ_00145 [Kitasatospora sp. NPDC056783]|uniref:hypothetical protein n=1 Tax=Kitasatospora sp. NPDC056783 TaxID=3345943 RepID=UPI0036B80BA4
MSIVLLGRWDSDNTLTITGSQRIDDGDQAAFAALVEEAAEHDGAHWACELDVDHHREAIQRAYDEYVSDDAGATLIDDVEGCEPDTW